MAFNQSVILPTKGRSNPFSRVLVLLVAIQLSPRTTCVYCDERDKSRQLLEIPRHLFVFFFFEGDFLAAFHSKYFAVFLWNCNVHWRSVVTWFRRQNVKRKTTFFFFSKKENRSVLLSKWNSCKISMWVSCVCGTRRRIRRASGGRDDASSSTFTVDDRLFSRKETTSSPPVQYQ